MGDFLIGLAFVVIVLSPPILATIESRKPKTAISEGLRKRP
jgi:hypothetical protein